MTFQPHPNLLSTTVITAPSPAASGTSLTVSTAWATKVAALSLPVMAIVSPDFSEPDDGNSEIVQITAANSGTGVLTIVRARESTSARAITAADRIRIGLTAKSLTDIEAAVPEAILTTNGDVIIRAGGAPARLAVGSANQLLGVSGGLPAWQSQSYIDHGALTGLGDDDHTQYVLRSILTTNGDILIQSGGVAARLAVGSANQVLGVSGGAPSWQAQSYLDHGSIGGLSGDDHAQYALLAGRATPQTLNLGTASGATAGYISSTAHATKGSYGLTASGSIVVDEANGRLGVGVSPSYALDVTGATRIGTGSTVGIGGAAVANVGFNVASGATDAVAAFGMYMGGQTLTISANNGNTYGFYAGGTVAVGAYTGITAIAAYIASQAKTGAGTVATTVGLYIGTPTIGTVNLGIVSPGQLPHLFGMASTSFTGIVQAQAPDGGTCMDLQVNATQANVTAADTFINFRSTSGIEGSIAGTASAGVIAYNTFTGAHQSRLVPRDRDEVQVHYLVEATGDMVGDIPAKTTRRKRQLNTDPPPVARPDGSVTRAQATVVEVDEVRVDKLAPKAHLPRVRICRRRKSRAVLGVWAGESAMGTDTILGIGTGFVLVANAGADIATGDYLMSSDVPGHCEKQDDDLLHNYTVAKASEAVAWAPGETARRVAVTYHCA